MQNRSLLTMVRALAFAAGALAAVYAIGWVVTWVRLAAARVPSDLALPAIDPGLIFVAGVRVAIAMAIAFAAMCGFAYYVHAWSWNRRANDWHELVKKGHREARSDYVALQAEHPKPGLLKRLSGRIGGLGRAQPPAARGNGNEPQQPAASRGLAERLRPQRAPDGLDPAPAGDLVVRTLAGFNVVVIAAVVGLALARLLKTPIDQASPGHWWALIGPWLLITLVLGLILARVNPLSIPSPARWLIWLGAGAVTLFCSAPIALLVLLWITIATAGRPLARTQSFQRVFSPAVDLGHSRALEATSTPLAWLLLAVYMLLGVAFVGMPPVSFAATTVITGDGSIAGGFVARTGAGVYLVACTPLADATDTDASVRLVPSGHVRELRSSSGSYQLDSGYRPTLATVAFHALGIDAETPAWIRPELKARKGTCAGSAPPRPSGTQEAPELGASVFASSGSAGRAGGRTAEPAIGAGGSKVDALALKYQPTLLVSTSDRFWPVSVQSVLQDVGAKGKHTCMSRAGVPCAVERPSLADLDPALSSPADELSLPAALESDPTRQFEAFVRGQQGQTAAVPALHEWLADPGILPVFDTAQVYFYFAGDASRLRFPVKRTLENGLDVLEYWFFYPFNYFPTVTNTDLMNEAPIAADVANTDLHEGDWEHVDVLVDARSGQARWLYMARHSDEGEWVPWDSPQLGFDGQGHPLVQGALGGHPTYEAGCGAHHRYAHGLRGLVSDWLVCGPGRFAFRATNTPLVDLATTTWACWKGHFGVRTGPESQTAPQQEDSILLTIKKYIRVPGPRSPLWQAENGHLAADGRPSQDAGFCANGADPSLPERAY